MEILYFNEIETRGVAKQYNKVVKFLQNGNFKSAEVKKIINSDFFRAKLDYENRLLFKFVTYEEKTYILLLEVIFNHEYEKSKFLRGVKVDENKLQDVFDLNSISNDEKIKISYLNQNKNYVHFLDKIISFDKVQDEILHFPPPVIIIGSAGSGKTALSLEKLKTLKGKILYTSLSSYLVDNAAETYFGNGFDNKSQEIEFLSFKELIESIEIPKTREITFREFDNWFNRYKQTVSVKDSYKIYEEFKGVITGGIIDKEYLSQEDYLSLGIKQSIFDSSTRTEIYNIFEKYLVFKKENNYHDINILSHRYLKKTKKIYDYIFVDEVQDLTNIQLFLILSTLKKQLQFVLSGDSNQIVHPNFFAWSHLKTMLFKSAKENLNILKILQTNYRNSPKITELSNRLLKIKNLRFGSIDKESTYLINSISKEEGSVNFYKDSEKLKKELNQKIQKSTKFAILVMDNSQKAEIKKYFKTPLVFSIQEAKGLEYENIILVNFITTNDKEFRVITDGVESEQLKDDLKFSRVKDKSNKELEVYKFYINSLYVAFTRAIENLYIIESSKKHRVLELLDLVKQEEKVVIDVKQSTTQEWQKEAIKLKKQGKLEQSEAIERELGNNKIKIVLTNEELKKLKREALSIINYNKKAKDNLFEFAKQEMDRELLKKLTMFKYKKARQFLTQLDRDFKFFYTACKENKITQVQKYIEKYQNINYSNEDNLNGLMIGAMYGSGNVIDYFLEKDIDRKIKNKDGLSAFELGLLQYIKLLNVWKSKYFKYQNIKEDDLNPRAKAKKENLKDELKDMADNFVNSYEKLKYPFMKCKIENKMVKIYPHSMEYFLLTYLVALKDKIIKEKKKHRAISFKRDCLNMDDFLLYMTSIPRSLLQDYRKKRAYINSILANNEVDRKFIYNKKLFKRKDRGCYDINPDLVFI